MEIGSVSHFREIFWVLGPAYKPLPLIGPHVALLRWTYHANECYNSTIKISHWKTHLTGLLETNSSPVAFWAYNFTVVYYKVFNFTLLIHSHHVLAGLPLFVCDDNRRAKPSSEKRRPHSRCALGHASGDPQFARVGPDGTAVRMKRRHCMYGVTLSDWERVWILQNLPKILRQSYVCWTLLFSMELI